VIGSRGRWELYVAEAERGSTALHVHAVNDWYPRQERFLWTTTPTCLEGVLDEIEEGLVVGRIVQPVGAVYSGSEEHEGRHHGFVVPDVPVAALDPIRNEVMDAYELLDGSGRGPVRRAAWNAYALQLYGDELLTATDTPGFVPQDTAEMAGRLFVRAVEWLGRARELAAGSSGAALDKTLPDWMTPTRSQEQLVAMRETLEAERTFLAYELASGPETELHERLRKVDRRLEEAALLWIDRLPAELRRGIGYALTVGLDDAYALGQDVAAAVALPSGP